MKNIFKYSLFVLLLGVASCDDATDITQVSELGDDQAFRNVEDLNGGLIGVYAAYSPDGGGANSGNTLLFNDLFTDNIKKGVDSNNQGFTLFNLVLQPSDPTVTSIYSNRLAVINYANRVLRAWDRIVPGLEDEAEIERANEIKAQLLAFRALAHFEMLQYFSEDYNESTLAVAIVDFVPSIEDKLPRNTVGEVFEFINNDLDEAQALMGDTYDTWEDFFSTNIRYYINPDVIKAIRTRVYLYQGNYTEAGNLADELVADYPMSPFAEYAGIFTDDELAGTEVIWSLSRVTGDAAITDLWFFNSPNLTGNPFFEVSDQLVALYDANDVRRSVLVYTSELPEYNVLRKYPGSADGPTINDFKVFRSSEMQLIRAEVAARNGNLDVAADLVRELQQRRLVSGNITPFTYSSLNQALTDILEERRKELAFEAHRYLDLKRLGSEVNIGIDRAASDCESFSAQNCSLAPNDYKFTLPIPSVEINANPTIQQNQGY
ncbi:RagB/SusD family nutrient uptake outer membrane protein [Flavobacterium coralii]|jgi:hypothetical protein|uniref:RagB/SusD family nutrient uptake outer membrane protein n=1 Tax=Flavobacterium coralii TaxID=2838017 RepID=UPI000C676BE2|nr:hypothetical protein [Flavobacterium sp.]|tara:strand:+ start:20793 stop:22265 length:1473 start_codon:yes stop_codon:yes gene_type:complete